MNIVGILRLSLKCCSRSCIHSRRIYFRWYDIDLYICAEMTKLLALKTLKVEFRRDLQRLIKNRS